MKHNRTSVSASYQPEGGLGRDIRVITYDLTRLTNPYDGTDFDRWVISVHYANAQPLDQWSGSLADVPSWVPRPLLLTDMQAALDDLMPQPNRDAEIIATLAKEYGFDPRDVATVLGLIRRAGYEVR